MQIVWGPRASKFVVVACNFVLILFVTYVTYNEYKYHHLCFHIQIPLHYCACWFMHTYIGSPKVDQKRYLEHVIICVLECHFQLN
uniref:Uncharacterized protein n=1 Tax=Aegilops tauschii subsp. strangulata TaxID=200361 RepID=A0A453CLX3_AEGTS